MQTVFSGDAAAATIGVSRGLAPKFATYSEARARITAYKAQERARIQAQQAALHALQDDEDDLMNADPPQGATPPQVTSATPSRGTPSTRASTLGSPVPPSRGMTNPSTATPSINRPSFVMPGGPSSTSSVRTSDARSDWSDLSETLSTATHANSGQSTTSGLSTQETQIPILVPISRTRLERAVASGGMDIRLQIADEGDPRTANSVMMFHLRQAAQFSVRTRFYSSTFFITDRCTSSSLLPVRAPAIY